MGKTALHGDSGKVSMTRVFVASCAIVGLVMAALSGLDWYNPSDVVFVAVFGAATGALLGKGYEKLAHNKTP